jgi:hypothetical protein
MDAKILKECLPYENYSEHDFIKEVLKSTDASTLKNLIDQKKSSFVEAILKGTSNKINKQLARAHQFRTRITRILAYVIGNPIYKAEEPAGDGLSREQFKTLKKEIIGKINVMEDPLQFMERCKEDSGAFLGEVLPLVPSSVKDQIEQIIGAYQGNTELPQIRRLSQITVYVGQPVRQAPASRPPLADAPIDADNRTVDKAVDAIPLADLERPYRFLSRVVGVVDGMLSNAKFAECDDDVEGEPLHISFDQYRVIRDAVNETLTGIRGVPPLEFFQGGKHRDRLKPLRDLIANRDDSFGGKIVKFYDKTMEIVSNFNNFEEPDFIPENVPFFVVETVGPPLPVYPPKSIVLFLDSEEIARRKAKIRDLRICINEMYFALQIMEIKNNLALELFADLMARASRLSIIDVDGICDNLQKDPGYATDPKSRAKYVKEALRRKNNKDVNNAMRALDYYKQFENCISRIQQECANFSENTDASTDRASSHYNAWCKIFGRVVAGAPLNKSVEEVRDTQWVPAIMPGSDFEEASPIFSKDNKQELDGKGQPKRKIVHEVYGDDDILHGDLARKVKVIWPPYEYVTGTLPPSLKPVRKRR